MTSFLLWIGAYNVAGALFLPALLQESFADRVLRKWLQILAEPYSHGVYGALWIWWAAIANLFLGGIMLAATRWNLEAQTGVTIGVLALYGLGVVLMLAAAQSPRFVARGIYGTLVLWVAQIAWGAWSVWKANRG